MVAVFGLRTEQCLPVDIHQEDIGVDGIAENGIAVEHL